MKTIINVLFLILSLLTFCSCGGFSHMWYNQLSLSSEDVITNNRMDEIVSAIRSFDTSNIKALFSNRAIVAVDDWDNRVEYLEKFIDGEIVSWEKDHWSSSEANQDVGQTHIIRFSFHLTTVNDEYNVFVTDYAKDTVCPDRQGIFMIEISKASYDGEWESWEIREKPGVWIVE